MHGEVCWLEVNTPDAEGALGFYGELLGWSEGPGDVGFPYHFLRAGGEKNFGGIMPSDPARPGPPPHWLVYFAVDDLEAAAAKVVKLGGSLRSPTVTMPQGRFTVVSDPQGATFALYQAA